MKPARPLPFLLLALCLISVAVGGALGVLQRNIQPHSRFALSQLLPSQPVHMERPYGMAPVAFEAYIRACNRTGIHPLRIGQTIGNHPRSVGYHKRDGELWIHGKKVDYSTAVDLAVFDLKPNQIDSFLSELAKQGFAAWYRHGPKWKNGEHIHAVYALLPMKPQLREQVRLFQRERREKGLSSLPWEAKLRRYRRQWRTRES